MNEDRLKGKWNQIKGEMKKKWAKLTDDDLLYGEGHIDKMIGRIQERTGEGKEEDRRSDEYADVEMNLAEEFQRSG
jgi:uncharacterized protein YjbJ (UPF0337 family)